MSAFQRLDPATSAAWRCRSPCSCWRSTGVMLVDGDPVLQFERPDRERREEPGQRPGARRGGSRERILGPRTTGTTRPRRTTPPIPTLLGCDAAGTSLHAGRFDLSTRHRELVRRAKRDDASSGAITSIGQVAEPDRRAGAERRRSRRDVSVTWNNTAAAERDCLELRLLDEGARGGVRVDEPNTTEQRSSSTSRCYVTGRPLLQLEQLGASTSAARARRRRSSRSTCGSAADRLSARRTTRRRRSTATTITSAAVGRRLHDVDINSAGRHARSAVDDRRVLRRHDHDLPVVHRSRPPTSTELSTRPRARDPTHHCVSATTPRTCCRRRSTSVRRANGERRRPSI